MSVAEKLVAVTDNIPKVHEAGKQAERDSFWDILQNKGNSRLYYYAFAYNRFNDKSYNPRYPINCSAQTTGAQHMFSGNTSITDTKVPIIINGTNANALFYDATNLKTIRELCLKKEGTTLNYAFTGCDSLEDITITGTVSQNISFSYSPLKKQSIENIIDCLSSAVADKTATFRLTAINTSFETSEGANDGSSSEEWLALVNSKPNWKIELV